MTCMPSSAWSTARPATCAPLSRPSCATCAPAPCSSTASARPIPLKKIVVDEMEMEFLYADGDDYYFMNTETFEQIHLNKDVLGDATDYLTSNLQIKVEFYDDKAVGVELPQTVELTVIETEPGLKSATAGNVTKPAKLETHGVLQEPPFINEGEKIRVDTAEGAYLSRA